MTTTESVLADLDATLDGRCACGCGRELNPAGQSGWWATEGCQLRWQHGAVRPGEAVPSGGEEIERAREALTVGFVAPSEAMSEWARQFADSLAPLIEVLEKARAIEAGEPTDPRERALWLRRNRNTGPKPDRQWSVRRLARESRSKRETADSVHYRLSQKGQGGVT